MYRFTLIVIVIMAILAAGVAFSIYFEEKGEAKCIATQDKQTIKNQDETIKVKKQQAKIINKHNNLDNPDYRLGWLRLAREKRKNSLHN